MQLKSRSVGQGKGLGHMKVEKGMKNYQNSSNQFNFQGRRSASQGKGLCHIENMQNETQGTTKEVSCSR